LRLIHTLLQQGDVTTDSPLSRFNGLEETIENGFVFLVGFSHLAEARCE
jgi:hypothetical protein